MTNYSFRYPLLNDAEWLRDLYILQKRSTIEIAQLAGAKSCNSARQALIRHQIPIRDYREAQIHSREDDCFILDLPVIEGGLLGDASLTCFNNHSKISQPYFSRKNKFRDHVEWVANLICGEWGVKQVTSEINTIKGLACQSYSFRTYSHERLRPLFDRWYPQWNLRVKAIPRDFDLNSTSLLHWFLDDGCCWQRRKESKTSQFVITFATECFSYDDQMFLSNQLNHKWDLKSTVRYYHTNDQDWRQYRIHLPQSQAAKFFKIIGPPPVQSLAYKWKFSS